MIVPSADGPGAGPARSTAAFLSVALCAFFLSAGNLPAQWESWRGPERSGVSRDTDIPGTWSEAGDNLVWKMPIGGRSTPVVHDGRVYILTRGGADETLHERVVSFDAETGKVAWIREFNVFHTTIPGPRVGWSSPCVDAETGYVYVHGVQGLFNCYDNDGKLIWSRSLTEDNGRISGYGGRTNTPVVDGDLVILSFLNSSLGKQGRGSHRYVAVDKRTGEFVWWSTPGGAPYDTTYSTPVVAVIDGVRLLICGAADGAVYALKVRTGEKVWGYRVSKRGFNVSPVISGNRVYIAHSEENVDTTAKGTVLCIDATAKPDANLDITKTGKVWRTDSVEVGYASPLLEGGILYVVDNPGKLIALDAGNGEELWSHSIGTVGKGSPAWVDGKIFVGEVNGRFSILEPSRSGCKELSRIEFKSPQGHVIEIFGSPAIANGRVYFSTSDATYCIGKKDWKGNRGEVPPEPAEKPAGPTDPPTAAIVRPAEVILRPGDKATFRIGFFNSRGQPVSPESSPVDWALAGLEGGLSPAGELTIPTESGYQFGEVVAKSGAIAAVARVRVVPKLPIEEDFSALAPGKLPTGWLGMSPLKFKIADLDGDRVLLKHGTRFELKFMRARALLGPASLTNYTVQADLRGALAGRKMPDMGLVNQRYELYLLGHRRQNKRKVRLVTWVAERRLMTDALFGWEPDIWYTVQFRVEPSSGGQKALVRGKVWKRGDSEPDAWTIEMEDPAPNLEGSPGLYAFSRGTTANSPGPDVYFDNVKIFSNR